MVNSLNVDWIAYVDENRLDILLESNGIVVDLLRNLRFGEITTKKDFLPSSDVWKSEILVSAIEVNVTYVGDQPLKYGNEFKLGYFELYNGESSYHWIINGYWKGTSYSLNGYLFEEYFEELDLDKKNRETMIKILNEFQLQQRLRNIHFQLKELF